MSRPPAAVANDVALATWLKLYVYAAAIEEQGRIPGCRSYTDEQWLGLCKVKLSGIAEAIDARLVSWEADSIVVNGYDAEGELKVAAARKRAQQNGARSAGRPRKPETDKPTGKPTRNRVGLRAANPAGGPSSSSSASSVTETGGRGSPSPHPLGGSRSDDARVEAVAGAYRRRFGGDPPWTAEDLGEHMPALEHLEPDVLGEIAALYFAADGERLGDAFWRSRGWPLRVLVRQAVPMFAAAAQEATARRRADAQRLRADEERRAAEKAASDERERIEAEQLAALPPAVRAWRAAIGDVGGRVGAAVAHARAEIAGDRLVVRLDAAALQLARARSPELERAFARHAGDHGPRLQLVESGATEAA